MSGDSTPDGRGTGVRGRPPRTSRWLVTVLALLGVLPLLSSSGVGVVPGALGAVLLGIGAHRGSKMSLDWGMALQVTGVTVGGLAGFPAGPLLVATLATLLAREIGRYGLVVGTQLGEAAPTRYIELAHGGIALVVGVTGVLCCYLVFLASGGVASVGAAVFLAIGAFALTAGLR